MSTRTALARQVRAVQRGGDDVGDLGRLHVDRQRADLQAAGVEQVADEHRQPVGLLVDGEQRLGDLVRASRRRVGSRRPETIALIDASGVRRSCDTARSIAVRTASMSASAAASFGLGGRASGCRWPATSWSASARRSRSSSGDSVPAEQGQGPSDASPSVRRSSRRRQCHRRLRDDVAVGATAAGSRRRRTIGRRRDRTSMRICSTSRWIGSGSTARLVVERTSASASRRARRASSERCVARSTSEPTATATAMNTTSEIRFSVRPIVNVPYGRDEEPVDEQRGDDGGDDPDEQSADRGDGEHDDERQQQFRRQVDRVRGTARSARRTAAGRRAIRSHPMVGAPAHGGAPRRGERASGRRSPVRAMTCTSMSGARRVTRATNEPWTSSCQRLRRLAPSTSWVAFSRRANAAIASAVSWPTTSCTVPPSSVDELVVAPASAVVVLLRQAVVDGDVHADQFATDPAGHPCGAADQRVAAGDAGEADDDPLAGLPRFGDAVRVEVAGAATPRRDRRPTASASSRSAPRLPGRK